MKATPAQLANLRPPWKEGQCGNPNKINNGRPKNRATELHKRLFGAKRAKAFYGITNEELETYDAMLETLTMAELQVLAKSDETPTYVKNYAIAILSDMKNGKTYTIDRVRENRHGKLVQRMELTGALATSVPPEDLSDEELQAEINRIRKSYRCGEN